jgi:hypothetical protein
MARSYRSMQPEALATRTVERAGGRFLPRIVEREPRLGDVHPLPSGVLRRFLGWVPLAYLHSLRRIELRPRVSERVGRPFGLYDPSERMIILYSLPLSWTWPGFKRSSLLLRGMRAIGAAISVEASTVTVTWPSPERLGAWFWREILVHELSHHYRQAFRGRRGKHGSGAEEIMATVYGDRLVRDIRRQMRMQRERRAAQQRDAAAEGRRTRG